MVLPQGRGFLGPLLPEVKVLYLALAAALGAGLTLLLPSLMLRLGALLGRQAGGPFRALAFRRRYLQHPPLPDQIPGPLQRLGGSVPLDRWFVPPPLQLTRRAADDRQGIRWLILGEPGSGKTTLLQMLALRWFEAARGRPQPFQSLLRTLVPPDLLPPWSPLLRQIPIWFPAARYRPGLPLAQQLAEQLYRTSQGALQAPVDLLERWLREGQCALFIDGLGQTRYGENEAALLEALERLAIETPCSILAAGTMELEGFHCFTLAPWSKAQISALLRAGKTLAALQGPARDRDRGEGPPASLAGGSGTRRAGQPPGVAFRPPHPCPPGRGAAHPAFGPV